MFGVVRNEYYGQVDQLKNSCGSHPPVIYIYCLEGGCATEFSTPSPAYPWKGAWSHRVRTAYSLCNGARLWGFVCSRTSCGQAASPYCSSSRLVTRHAPLSLARNKPSVVTNRGHADTNKKNVSCRTHTMPLPSLVGRSYHTSLYF